MAEGPLHDTSRYQIGDELGRGGMGRVLAARDLWLGRPVAIKILPPDLGHHPDLVARLEREARALARLSHPAIATIYSLERTRRGDRLLILERVEGETLAKRLRRGPLPVPEALRVARELAEALEAAHECGVIHRDLKPSNVMITPQGHVKVLDFGLAKIVPTESREPDSQVHDDRSTRLDLTRGPQAVGTPGYASPEQAHGKPADRRADVFAFGCVLFESLSAARAFPGTGEVGFEATARGEPPWGALPADVPKEIRDLIRRCVASDPASRPQGLSEVRDAIGRVLGQEATPLAARAGPRHNLPEPLTSFVGREREISVLRETLAAPRLVTLTGPGGAGKTRLALHVARESWRSHPDGVWLADLAPVTDPGRVPHALTSALALRERPDAAARDVLLEHLRDKAVLVVLDNCEHLLPACATLAGDLLKSCPSLRVLATSREALHVSGERVLSVPPLGLAAAARLFVERAQAVRPDIQRTPRDLEIIEEICLGLEGLPLAVELAAARAKVLSLQEIRAKLADKLRLLAGGTMSGVERHRTLTATIGWSYDLLTSEEQRFARSLAVFAGGWTLEAARDVGGEEGGGQDEFEILDLLSRLVDKSLVVAEAGVGDRFRFRWLETVRQYALERLRASGEEAAARNRHLAYFHGLVFHAAPELVGRDQGEWLKRLESDHENLLTALGWCRGAPGGGKRALEMGALLWRFWVGHGHLTLARGLLGAILADPAAAGPSEARGEALLGAGALAFHQNDFDSGARVYLESLEVFRAMGDERGMGAALLGLGNLDLGRGDFESARARYDASLEHFRRARNERGIGLMRSNVGRLEELRGDLVAALPLLEEGIEIMRRVGDVGSLALRLSSLAELRLRQGENERARGLLLECLGLIPDLGESYSAAYALERSAVLLARDGAAAEAVRLCGAADQVRRRIASPPSPIERKDLDAFFVSLQRQTGGTAFGEAWNQGRAFTYRGAVETAIAALSRPASGPQGERPASGPQGGRPATRSE
jgi:non-specific serine/threonine protein kinase